MVSNDLVAIKSFVKNLNARVLSNATYGASEVHVQASSLYKNWGPYSKILRHCAVF